MVDFLIVGGGMAGCNLTYNVIKNGYSVMMVDDNDEHASSSIAGGIFNPLLPKHHKISYNAEHIYPMLTNYYKEFEGWLGEKVLFEQPVHYILPSSAEQNDWSALAYSSHIGHWVEVNTNKLHSNLRAPFGYLKIKHSGWVDTKKLCMAFKSKLASTKNLMVEKFDYDLLKTNDGEIHYKEIKAKQIVFCEGIQIENNTISKDIQLKPAKGEILIIKTEMNVDYIAQQGVFMLPLGDNLFKVGSNFTWDSLDNLPTGEGKAEILSKLVSFYKADFEVVDHYAGVRPSSSDRRPIIGKIKPFEHCYVFNGLGSKGVALAPYYSMMLVNHFMTGEAIDKEVISERKLK